MIKRIFYILFPLFAVLCSFDSMAGKFIDNNHSSDLLFSSVSSGTHNHTASISKDETPKKKHKIRIKAWDDYSPANVAEPWILTKRIVYYQRAAYKAYQAYFLTAHFTRYNLRGPPAA